MLCLQDKCKLATQNFQKGAIMNYLSAERAALLREYEGLSLQYKGFCAEGLNLDLSRGKPSGEQLDLCDDFFGMLREGDFFAEDGFDCRNYGVPFGLPEAKRFFSAYTGVPAENIIVGGNSSLNLMYDALCRCMLYGTADSKGPWCREGKLKFLCPSPGYDRHFAVTESLGFELVYVPMTEEGPDMDVVEELVKDGSVKGIWCVPKYSNPTGITYSDEVVRRLASMKTAAPDFRIFWDNAYAIHFFDPQNDDTLLDIFEEAKRYGNENRVFYFTSTSKVTLPGAGISMIAASEENLTLIKKVMAVQTIGHDKLNQLRHVRMFEREGALLAKMAEHGAVIRRKFDLMLSILKEELADTAVAAFTEPRGGYFSSLNVLEGCATRVYNLCLEAGVQLTKVGATFPYGRDPEDKNLRLAPTYASDAALEKATKVLCVAVKMAAIEKLSGKM